MAGDLPSIHDPLYAEVLGVARALGHPVTLHAHLGMFAQARAPLPGPVHDDFPAKFSVNRTVRSEASVLAVRVEPDVLLATALFGAAALGRYAEVERLGGVRDVLRFLAASGTPLLVATGCEGVRAKLANPARKFRAGSPTLLCDKDGSVICVAVPMGDVVEAPDKLAGVLPADLRAGDACLTSVQMFLRVVSVAPYPKFGKQQWFKNHDAAFRWDLLKKSMNPTSVLPVNAVFVDLFNKYGSLDGLHECLGDYEAKLAALKSLRADKIPPAPRGAPPKYSRKKEQYDVKMQQRRQQLSDNPCMATEWRRALLLQRVLEEDRSGVAYAALAGVLPERMVGPPRACTAQPVREFGPEDLRAVDVGTLGKIQAAVAGVRMP